MIEASLVHIHMLGQDGQFVGCGALVEGGYLATCRHVWRDAGGPDAKDGAVKIIFPQLYENGVPAERTATLADSCDMDELGRRPDLVLLSVVELPTAAALSTLSVVRDRDFEHGEAQAFARIPTRELDIPIGGTIADLMSGNERNFGIGGEPDRYWLEPGSSGAPVILRNPKKLAGLVRLSETARRQEDVRLREAFIVPATTIWYFLDRRLAKPPADSEQVNVSQLRELLEDYGHSDVPTTEIAERLRKIIEGLSTLKE